MPRQFENALGDDVEHDLARAALDRIGLGRSHERDGARRALPRSPTPAPVLPPAAISSSCRRLLSSVPAYFIMLGCAGCALPTLISSRNFSPIAAKASAVDIGRGQLGAQHRIIEAIARQHLADRACLLAAARARDHLALVRQGGTWRRPSRDSSWPTDLALGHLHVIEEGLAERRARR
jgi:hypothetical protein